MPKPPVPPEIDVFLRARRLRAARSFWPVVGLAGAQRGLLLARCRSRSAIWRCDSLLPANAPELRSAKGAAGERSGSAGGLGSLGTVPDPELVQGPAPAALQR